MFEIFYVLGKLLLRWFLNETDINVIEKINT